MLTSEGRVKVLDFGLAKRLRGPVSLQKIAPTETFVDKDQAVVTLPIWRRKSWSGNPADERADYLGAGRDAVRNDCRQRPFPDGTRYPALSAGNEHHCALTRLSAPAGKA